MHKRYIKADVSANMVSFLREVKPLLFDPFECRGDEPSEHDSDPGYELTFSSYPPGMIQCDYCWEGSGRQFLIGQFDLDSPDIAASQVWFLEKLLEAGIEVVSTYDAPKESNTEHLLQQLRQLPTDIIV